MKKKLLVILLFSLCVLSSFAVEINYDDYIKAPVQGNAKTVTTKDPAIGYYRGPKGGIYVQKYDNLGRLLDDALIIGDSVARGEKYQYENQMYWIYQYDSKGLIDGVFTYVQLDSLGRKISSFSFNKNIYYADSIAYNQLGQKIEEYTIPTIQDTMVLKYVYTYDSLGRLSTVKNVKKWEGYKVEYGENGNYTEYHYKEYNANGKRKKYEKKFYYADGNLVKIISDGTTIRFSKFDEKGNWQKAFIEWGGTWSISRTLTRTIEYYAPAETDTVYLSSEQLPEFPGGQKAMFQYISDNAIYPLSARKNGIQGRTVCQFVVNKSGDLADIVVIKSSGDNSLDQEAVRIISSMPKWIPGRSAGEIVRVKYTVPVSFKMTTPVPTQKPADVQNSDSTIHAIVDEMPEFTGGQQALFDYLSQHIKYPEKANGATGRVIVEFVVEKDGQISNMKIAKSSGNEYLDAEAIRLIRTMPKWKPGKLKGKPVRVKYCVPIKFGISD